MPKYKLIKLKKISPLHIGTGQENYSFSVSELQSDTISSALAAIYIQNGEKIEDVEQFLHSFVISSAFPFRGNRFFLPKFQGKIPVKIIGEEEHHIRKSLKKVSYIEKELWDRLVNGEEICIQKEQIKNEYIISENSFEDISKKQVNQRVKIYNETEKNTDPFYFEWNFFHPKAGLFCLVDCNDSTFDKIVSLFSLLGENGLGTDKNIGGGFIAGSWNEQFRHLRKKSIYMFNTGSLFATTLPLKGKIVDLKPKWNTENMHSVFRSGRPFYLPIKINHYE